MSNIETVQQLYAAFGRGDISTILQLVSPDVAWDNAGDHRDIPWLAPRRGRAEVAGFFEALEHLVVHHFEPKTFLASGDLVIVLIDEEVTVKRTGKRIRESDQVHLWSFDENGSIVRHRQRVDTHRHWLAYHEP
jgi:uncharacterized protein